MVRRAGGAQGGHGVGKAQLRQGDDVHIALGNQCIAFFAQMCARFKQTVELAPFTENRGLGRIEVFGLFIA